MQYFSDFAQTYRALRWLMGDLDVASYQPIVAALPLVLLAFGAFTWLARPLNLISLGDDTAAPVASEALKNATRCARTTSRPRVPAASAPRLSRFIGRASHANATNATPMNLLSLGADAAGTRGLDVVRAQRVAFFSASLVTGAAVSIGGPIGFVGIIVPHLVRLVVGADHRLVLPVSTFVGAAFLVACDVVARTVFAPMELPVGIVTALIGGPFFLWLLLRRT